MDIPVRVSEPFAWPTGPQLVNVICQVAINWRILRAEAMVSGDSGPFSGRLETWRDDRDDWWARLAIYANTDPVPILASVSLLTRDP